MGVRRYSPLPSIRKVQERFDELQERCNGFHNSPTIAELREAGVKKAYATCRNFQCLHQGDPFELASLPSEWTVWRLRKRPRFTCGRCGTMRAKFRMVWDG